METRKLIIVRGPSGSFKTTIARKLIEGKISASHCEADMFFGVSGSYEFDPKLLHKAEMWCKLSVEEAMNWSTQLIVVSNTFVRKWEMQPYLDLAVQKNYEVEVLRTPGPWDPVILTKRNLHGVQLHTIIQQINRFEDFPEEKIVTQTFTS